MALSDKLPVKNRIEFDLFDLYVQANVVCILRTEPAPTSEDSFSYALCDKHGEKMGVCGDDDVEVAQSYAFMMARMHNWSPVWAH